VSPSRECRFWWGAAVFVAYLLGVRLYLVCGTSLEWVRRDTESYFEQARAILDGGLIDYFPNGLPMTVAGVWSAFGAEVTEQLVLINVACSVATAAGVFYLARDWFEGLAGAVLAVVAIAHWPNHLRFVPRILTDIPAACFVTLGLWALVRRRGIPAGLLLGLAVTFRSSLALIWLGGAALCALREQRTLARESLLAGLVPVGLLAGYGYLHTGALSIGGNFSYNLLKSIDAYRPGLHFDDSRPPAVSSWGAVRIYAEYIWSHPWTYLEQRGFALWQMWGPWPLEAENRSALSRFLIGWRTPLLMLGIWGFWLRRAEWRAWLLALPAASLTVVHLFFFGHPRFTVPAEPALCILASEGLLGLKRSMGI